MAVLDYCEIPVSNVAAEAEFYRAAFGWEFTGYGPEYAAHEAGPCQFGLNGGDNAQKTKAILPVIRVTAIEIAKASVIAAGGTITLDIFDFPGGRRFHFTDPEGLELAVYEPG